MRFPHFVYSLQCSLNARITRINFFGFLNRFESGFKTGFICLADGLRKKSVYVATEFCQFAFKIF